MCNKTTLFMPDPQDNFEIKILSVKFSKIGDKKCGIKPIYIQGVLYHRKENT